MSSNVLCSCSSCDYLVTYTHSSMLTSYLFLYDPGKRGISKHLKVKEYHQGDVENYIGIGLYLSRHVIQSLKSRQLLKFPQFKSPITVLHL